MPVIKIEVFFQTSGFYRGWCLRSPVLGEIALSARDPNDPDKALDEAAKLLGCPRDRLQTDCRERH